MPVIDRARDTVILLEIIGTFQVAPIIHLSRLSLSTWFVSRFPVSFPGMTKLRWQHIAAIAFVEWTLFET